jgi:hypothetical protein
VYSSSQILVTGEANEEKLSLFGSQSSSGETSTTQERSADDDDGDEHGWQRKVKSAMCTGLILVMGWDDNGEGQWLRVSTVAVNRIARDADLFRYAMVDLFRRKEMKLR